MAICSNNFQSLTGTEKNIVLTHPFMDRG